MLKTHYVSIKGNSRTMSGFVILCYLKRKCSKELPSPSSMLLIFSIKRCFDSISNYCCETYGLMNGVKKSMLFFFLLYLFISESLQHFL